MAFGDHETEFGHVFFFFLCLVLVSTNGNYAKLGGFGILEVPLSNNPFHNGIPYVFEVPFGVFPVDSFYLPTCVLQVP